VVDVVMDIPPSPPPVTVAGHEVALYTESRPLIEAMIYDIHAARQRIWLESYIVAHDALTAPLFEALAAQARAGLDVRLSYDAVGSQETPQRYFDQLVAAGVQVRAFHTIWEGLSRFALFDILNRRNHRKLLVIDDHIGYFGGMNIVDTASPEAHTGDPLGPTPSGGWRDVHLRLSGPQVPEMAASFLSSWERKRFSLRRWRRRGMRARLFAHGPAESIRFVDSGPIWRYSRAARYYNILIRHARTSITLSMAYFIPLGEILRSLLRARKRGVLIRVITPQKSDVPLVQACSRYMYTKLLRRGFRLYQRRDRMLHSKVMVVDQEWTLVGSCNLDPRSLFINQEFFAIIRSPALAKVILDICQFEIAHSDRVGMAHVQNQTWGQRAHSTLAWMLRWWL